MLSYILYWLRSLANLFNLLNNADWKIHFFIVTFHFSESLEKKQKQQQLTKEREKRKSKIIQTQLKAYFSMGSKGAYNLKEQCNSVLFIKKAAVNSF